jgi:hypothetical protein
MQPRCVRRHLPAPLRRWRVGWVGEAVTHHLSARQNGGLRLRLTHPTGYGLPSNPDVILGGAFAVLLAGIQDPARLDKQ